MDVNIEQALAGSFELDSCEHRTLILWATFDHLYPARCEACGAPFTLREASTHVHSLNGRRDSLFKRSRIYVNYAMAVRSDAATGETHIAIPDLKASARHDSAGTARDKCMELVSRQLIERAEDGLLPPPPRTIDALKEVNPVLAGWEWHWVSIAVTSCLPGVAAG